MSLGLIINHNLGSMNALAALGNTQNSLQTELQQLSTGKQINSAADNAAGYAISQKMQSQIDGLNQASQNSQDGISLIQTASGALNETQSILERMRQLAVQSSNDTNTSQDRQDLQSEVSQLTSELNNISSTTQFNTQYLLTGSLGASTSDPTNISQIGQTSATQAGQLSFGAATSFTLAKSASYSLTTTGTTVTGTGGALTLTANGNAYTVNVTAGESMSSVVSQINSTVNGVTAAFNTSTKAFTITSNDANASQSITLTEAAGNDFDSGHLVSSGTTTAGANAKLAAGTVTDSAGTAVTGNLAFNGNQVTVLAGLQQGVSFSLTPDTGSTTTATVTNQTITIGSGLTLQIGANSNQTMTVNINAMDATSLGVGSLDLTSQTGAENAINSLDTALQTVSLQQANLGAYQNRLQDSISNVDTASQNLTTAQSGITDTNMAQAMADFTKDNVLQQAAISMLAQANQQPQLVLKLLG
jgi:flagellin